LPAARGHVMSPISPTSGPARLAICLLLAALTLTAYWQVRDHRFTTWDDDQYVTDNPMVRAGLTPAGVRWACTAVHAYNWHPLTWLSHMLDCQLFGLQPRGPHLTNLAFHLANTLLWFLLFARLTGALWPSAMVAALFALHPLHVESVAWVAERKDVLSTFFWLAGLWAYVWYVAAPGRARYSLIVLSFCLGLLAKPMPVTLPFTLLLLDYWPLGRLQFGPGPWRRIFWSLIREKIPLFIIAALGSGFTLLVQQRSGAIQPLSLLPVWPRLANAAVAYVTYLVKLVWPYPMVFFYPLVPVPLWKVVGAALILLGLSAWLLSGARRHPYLATGWLWYLGTLVPVIGLVQVGGQALADRYTYVPFIGLFIIISWGAADFTAGWRHRKILLSLGAGVVLSACLAATWFQVRHWRDSASLFTYAITINPQNYMAYNHLGLACLKEGHTARAIAMFRKTIEISPGYLQAYQNLGLAYAGQGRWNEAVQVFRQAIQVYPGYASAYHNLGVIYYRQGNLAEAAKIFEQGIRMAPGHAELYRDLGVVYWVQGKAAAAVALMEQAGRLAGD
jgi:hypothetical protein